MLKLKIWKRTMVSAKLYPGGVVNREGGDKHMHETYSKLIITRPDPKVEELHKSNFTAFVNNDSFEFKKEVIETCIRLYGDFYRWLQYQLIMNRFVYGVNQEFLIDTLWYIKTGERKVMLPVWESIITQYPDLGDVKPKRLEDTMVESFLKSGSNYDNPYSGYITEWTSHPDGIYDMLYTTYLLFGRADLGVLNKLNFTS